MSFILNALRKSEQERQARQSETVTDKILVPQPPQQRNNTTKFFVALILANVLIIAGFAWFIRNNLISSPSIPAPAVPQQLEPKAVTKPTQAKSEVSSIAELIDESQNALPVKPATIKNTAKSGAITSTAANDIPYLNDLPFEFRQNLPKFTINVFVYSKVPEDRFVMIDMVKYKPGQQIKNAMLLKEILPDSFTVDYQNRTFRIKRP
jgi:general secretion pathway protein B